MSSLKGWIKVSRPPLLLMGLLGPLACLSWRGGPYTFKDVLIMLSIFTGNWAWNLYNEYHDVKVDSIDKPWKPIPAGEVEKQKVAVMFGLLFSISVILVFFTSLFYNFIYLFFLSAHYTAYLYNEVRRDTVGNIAECITIGMAPLFVLYPKGWYFALGLTTLFFGIALITQYQDLVGEKALGIKTAPQELGQKGTALVSTASLLLSVLIYSQLNIYSRIFFIISAALNIVCSNVILSPLSWSIKKRLIEVNSRIFGRVFILLGFLHMIFFL